jgi:hypothetical protein
MTAAAVAAVVPTDRLVAVAIRLLDKSIVGPDDLAAVAVLTALRGEVERVVYECSVHADTKALPPSEEECRRNDTTRTIIIAHNIVIFIIILVAVVCVDDVLIIAAWIMLLVCRKRFGIQPPNP